MLYWLSVMSRSRAVHLAQFLSLKCQNFRKRVPKLSFCISRSPCFQAACEEWEFFEECILLHRVRHFAISVVK